MITLPVSFSSIRASDGSPKPVSGAAEPSFGEILERQVDAGPDAAPRNDRGRDAEVHPDDVRSSRAGARLEHQRREPATDAAPMHSLDHAPDPALDQVETDAAERIDVGHADDTDDDADDDAGDATGTDASHSADPVDRRAPACQIAAPLDGRRQSLPAPSGQAPAEPVPVAEVAAVSSAAVPAADPAAAAVEPLTTAAAALAPTVGATDAITNTALEPPATAGGTPEITGVTVDTVPVTDAAIASPSLPSSAPLPSSTPLSPAVPLPSTIPLPSSTPAASSDALPETFGASPVNRPLDARPGASANSHDAAPAAATHPAIGDVGRVATPSTATTPAEAAPTALTGAVPAASGTSADTTSEPATAVVAAATTAAATAADDAADDAAPAAPRVRGDAAPATTDRADAPAGQATVAATAATTASGAAVASADGAGDGITSAPLRSNDIAAQAQREAQVRRAEHLTRLGIDVTTDGLGAIRIEASNAGGGLQLNLGAERASTRHLLAEHVAVLRDELGGGNVSVDIGRGDAGRQPPGERRQPGALPPHPARQAVDAATHRRPALAHLVDADRGLDLHL